jgi:glucose/arabinose dehydrogenase
MRTAAPAPVLLFIALAGCGDRADLPLAAAVGPAPQVPEPTRTAIPTVKVADATGWPEGVRPQVHQGLALTEFASGLDHPRWLHALPNGDILVAETAAPPAPKAGKGIKGFFMKLFMKKAGSAVPSANRISLLRDADGDGVAETRTQFLTGLNSPFGMALVGSSLYVANSDGVLRFPYRAGTTRISAAGVGIAALPAGDYNQHWTRGLAVSPDGSKLYVSVGSASNIAEHGFVEETGRAAIQEIDLSSGRQRIYASGLRNPVGIAFEPGTQRMWTVVNERDELGSDVPPDYLTSVVDGGFYGWPYSYWGRTVDMRVKPQRPDLVASALTPDYALGPHVAPLGLAFAQRARLGPQMETGAFIALHGSWNRSPRSGYKVIFVPFAGGRPSGPPLDIATGFLSGDRAYGRPVGLVIDPRGGLLIADDVGNRIWRITGIQVG